MVESGFDDEWKLEVEEKVLEYSKQNLKDLDVMHITRVGRNCKITTLCAIKRSGFICKIAHG